MKAQEALKAFEKLGMQIREGRDTLAFFYHRGHLVLWTKVPHQRGELRGQLPHYIRQQLKLTEKEFQQLIRCQIGRTEYEQILRAKGIIQ
jgi:hypothetical protein